MTNDIMFKKSEDKFDWSQVRIIFIAGAFDKYQKDAVNNPDQSIDLYEAKLFDNDEMVLNKIEKNQWHSKKSLIMSSYLIK